MKIKAKNCRHRAIRDKGRDTTPELQGKYWFYNLNFVHNKTS